MADNEPKPILSSTKEFDILNIPKGSPIFNNVNNPNLFMQNFQQKTPEFKPIVQTPIIIKEEPKPKKGFEGWYEKHTGKITFTLGILAVIFAIIAIVETYIIYRLTRPQ